MFRSRLTNYKRTALMAAGAFGHSYAKYRRFSNRNTRTRTRTRYGRKSATFSKKKRRSTKKRINYARKRKTLRRAFKKGAYKYVTARRTEKVSLSFPIDAEGTSGDAQSWDADAKWFGSSKTNKNTFNSYQGIRFRSVSWKFDNFKVRTILRTVTTEGNPPEDVTQEQVLEPSFVRMRYKHNKWNDQTNPNYERFHDKRIEEIMQSKCITNCRDKFWGIYKPRNTIVLTGGPPDGDYNFRTLIGRTRTTSINEDGAPYLSYWFSCESTLPKQFFVADPPVKRTAKILVDCDCTFYSKFMCFRKKIDYG